MKSLFWLPKNRIAKLTIIFKQPACHKIVNSRTDLLLMALNCFVRRLLAWLFGCHWYWQFLLACIQIKARTGYCPDLETKFENSPQLIARVGVGQIRDQPLFTMGLGFESCFKEHKLKFVERSWKFRLIKNYPLKF